MTHTIKKQHRPSASAEGLSIDSGLVRGMIAAKIIRESLSVSSFIAFLALRQFAKPVRRVRGFSLYSIEDLGEVIARVKSGEWPKRRAVYADAKKEGGHHE